MKNYLLLSALLAIHSMAICQNGNSTVVQKRATLNERTIVKDSNGNQYPYEDWKELMRSGDFILRAKDPKNEHTEFVIHKLSLEEKERMITNAPKPPESQFFTTGNSFGSFRMTDMYKNRFNSKELAGKIVVFNFWFINCAPCRAEMPELNKLVKKYSADSNVVFIAISLDQRSDIRDFLKDSPFDYQIIDDGRSIADRYGVKSYPTHVVVNKQGVIYFHTSGLGRATVHWIDKSIEEIETGN